MSNIGGGGASLGSAGYIITGNAQSAVNAARQAQAALSELAGVVSSNWWGIQNLGLAFAALPAAMSAGVGYAIKAASDMEDAVFAIQRTSGLTGAALDEVVDQVQAVARTTAIATTELADLAATGAALGIPNEALGEFARIMGVLISSTNLTAESADDLARAMNVLQVPNSEMERFATVLLEVGRNTAATESEILNATKRISGVARAAGFAAHDVLGISAAILSLGPRAEAGSTSFNKTISDMARAVSKGVSSTNKNLALFADVSGQSAAEFAASFQQTPEKAFAGFLTGLARLQAGVDETNYGELLADTENLTNNFTAQVQVLDALGIKESRQAQALLSLAGGTLSVGNEQRDLNAILAASAKYWEESTALTDVQEQKAATLSGQLQILKNIIFEAASAFGSAFLPVLKPIITFLGDMVRGINLLPGPVKFIFALISGLIGIVAGLGAIFVLTAPRLILARDAFYKIVGGIKAFQISAAQARKDMVATAIQAQIMSGQMSVAAAKAAGLVVQARNANGQFAKGFTIVGDKAKASAAGIAVAGKSIGKFGRIAGIAGTVATIGTIALTVATSRMGKQQRATEGDTEALADANLDLAEASGTVNEELLGTEENAKKASKAARELRDELEGVAQAHLAYVEAQREQVSAQAALAKAQEDYQDAVEKHGDDARALRRGELELAQARRRHQRSLESLADAETDLANARQETEEEIVDKENDLADARDKQADSADRLVELEEKLAGMRGDDYLDDITEATNDLRNAELRLARAHVGLSDAEWYLNYLREEGASSRDISDAELILAEARQEVADSEEDLAEKTEELNELRDESRRQREIAAVERDIADAKRDSAAADRDIIALERELGELRQSLADGSYINEAQDNYHDALLEVEEAIDRVREAEQKLEDLRAGLGAREIAASQRDYVGALIAVAKANMEARKQQALMRGEIFDAGDEAHVLAEELRKLADSVPDAGVRKQLLDFAAILGAAPNVPDPVKEAEPDAGAGAGGGDPGIGLGEAIMDGVKKGIEKKQPEVKKSLWDSIMDATGGKNGIGAIAGGIIGTTLGATLGAAFGPLGALLGGVLGSAIGSAVGATIAKHSDKWMPIAKWLFNVEGVTEGARDLKKAWGGVMDFFSTKGRDTAVEVEKAFGKSTGNIIKEAKFAERAVQDIFLKGEPVTKEQTDKIIGHVNNMQSNTVHAAEEMAKGQMDSVNFLKESGNPVWDEIANQAIGNIERQKLNTVNESEQMRAQIVAKLEELRDKGIPITAELAKQVSDNIKGMAVTSTENLSDGSIQQQVVLAKLKAEAGTITKEMASEIIKESVRARDGAVTAAEEKYNRTIEETLKLQKAGLITKEQADKIIGEAKRQRDEAVGAAQDQHSKVVGEMERQRHGLNREVDLSTGELRSRWDVIRGDIVEKFRGAGEWLGTAGYNLMVGFKGGIDSEGNTVPSLMERIKGSITRVWDRAFELLRQAGKDIIAGFIKGITDRPNWVRDTLSSVLGPLAPIANKLLGNASPSKIFAGIGRNVTLGLIEGIMGEQGELEKAMQQITDALGSEFTASFGAQLQAFDLDYLTKNLTDPLAGMNASGGTGAPPAQNVTNNYYETLNLEAMTNADPQEIMNEYSWRQGIRARSRG